MFLRALVLWNLFTVCKCDTYRAEWSGCTEEIISSSLCNDEKSLPPCLTPFLSACLRVCVCVYLCCRTRVQTTVSGWTWACGTSSASWPLSALSRSWNLPNECLASRGWPSRTRSRSWKLPAWTFWWVCVLLFWRIKLGVQGMRLVLLLPEWPHRGAYFCRVGSDLSTAVSYMLRISFSQSKCCC